MKIHNVRNGGHRFIGLTLGHYTVGVFKAGRWYFTAYSE
jgi:hypothetical protein